MCTDKDGKDLPASQCRDETPEEGEKVLDKAESEPWKWTEGKNSSAHCAKDIGHHVGDCADAVESWQEGAGLPAISPTPHVSNGDFAASDDYRDLKGGPLHVGDIVIYNGGTHASIATGKTRVRNGQVQVQVYQNGVHGTGYDWANQSDATIYRRLLPVGH